MREFLKPFLKKSDKKIINRKINIKMPYENKKPIARNGNFENQKLGLE